MEVVLARRQHAHQRALTELFEADRAAVRCHSFGLGLAAAASAARRSGEVRERREHGDVVEGKAQLLPRARGGRAMPGVDVVAAGDDGPAEVDEAEEDDGDEGADPRVLQRRGRRAGHCLGDRARRVGESSVQRGRGAGVVETSHQAVPGVAFYLSQWGGL